MSTSALAPPAARWTLGALLLALALALGACDDGGGGPGGVVATVVSPHGAEGAVLLELSGARIDAVEAPQGRALVREVGSALQVAVVREVPGEIRLLLTVADRDAPLVGTVLQAVDGDNRRRTVGGGYSVRFTR